MQSGTYISLKSQATKNDGNKKYTTYIQDKMNEFQTNKIICSGFVREFS